MLEHVAYVAVGADVRRRGLMQREHASAPVDLTPIPDPNSVVPWPPETPPKHPQRA